MDTIAKTLQTNNLANIVSAAPQGVLNSIRKASARTGVDFTYLVKQAHVESSFNPKAKAKTSSASGLYQFLDSTWLSMVKKYGDKYGMGDLADKIGAGGKVANRAVKKEILNLRNDPEKAAALAAEFASENERYLKSNWGGDVGSTELYLAHFMGAGGASEFLKARDDNPMQRAAVIFPAAAKSNRNVFYDVKTGRAKSLDEVYAFFDKKFDAQDGLPALPQDDIQTASLDVSDDRHANSVIFTPSRPATSYASLYSVAMPSQNLVASPVELMLLAQMDLPGQSEDKHFFTNSRYID